jgi:membrane protease YdiL (CAAX protease family)
LLYGGSLGEEVGWRGFALERLLERMSPVRASALLAVFWALWHAPIDVTFGFGLPGPGAVVVRLVWTLPLAMLFTWMFLRSGSSLLAPLALHASFNVLPDLGFSNSARATGLLFLAVLVAGLAAAAALDRRPAAPPDDAA